MPRVSSRASSRKGGDAPRLAQFPPSRADGERWERHRALRERLVRWLIATRAEIAEVAVELQAGGLLAGAFGARAERVEGELCHAVAALEEALFAAPESRAPQFVEDERWDRTRTDGAPAA